MPRPAEDEVLSINADYEKKIELLQKERDEKAAKAKMKLELIGKLIEFENADLGKVPPAQPAALPPL